MKVASRWSAALCIFIFALLPVQAQSYRDELDRGVAAYKNNHYEEAIQHFRKATELDPSQTIAHMYLATACVSQYIPGVDTPDNTRLAEQAVEQYQRVLDSEAIADSKVKAAKGIAYLYLNMKKFEEAKHYYEMASRFDPNDPEPYYSIGVIDWTSCYQPRMEARARLEIRPDQHLNAKNPEQKRICDELQANNWSAIEEGMSKLDKAIELRPDYDDAMAYMNLLYRERADLECEDPMARDKDLKTADEWVDKTLAVKRAKAEKTASQVPRQ